ncbi:MAG: efflux RND transporter periplasmic adaptor subunit [Polyangia bacterium]
MKTFLKVLLGLGILLAGFGLFYLLTTMKQKPERQEPPDGSAVVEVTEVAAASGPATIGSMGVVVPAREVTVVLQVSGRAVEVSPDLVPGGRVREGQLLARIDPRDYDLAIRQQRAAVTSAEMELATERARKEVAEREWSLIADELRPSEEGRKLALREIQIETAEAALDSARSGLDQARLARSRTAVRAPFDAVVIEEMVDEGQVLGPSSKVATLVDSTRFWVRATVPMDRLPWISLPDEDGEGGSRVLVSQRVGPGDVVERRGRVVRLLGDLDELGKMARLLIEVSDPLGPEGGGGAELPLLLGAYVNAEIEGPELKDVVSVPRTALRDRDRLWIKRDGELAIETIEVVWTTEQRVFVRGDVSVGEQVVTSRIPAPVEGMPLKVNGVGDADAGSAVAEPTAGTDGGGRAGSGGVGASR